jgi:hypothetical protein
MLERGKEQVQKFFLGFDAERLATLAIDANDLLVTGDDACFDRGNAFRVGEHAFVRDVHGAETLLESTAGLITADNAESFDKRA